MVRYEYNLITDGTSSSINPETTESWAQSFTVGRVGPQLESFRIKSIKILVYRTGLPGICDVWITDSVGQSKTYLAVGEFDGNNLTTNSSGEWYTISNLDRNPLLHRGITYYLIISPRSYAASARVRWIRNFGGNPYPGGNAYYSFDKFTVTNYIVFSADMCFEIWGDRVLEISEMVDWLARVPSGSYTFTLLSFFGKDIDGTWQNFIPSNLGYAKNYAKVTTPTTINPILHEFTGTDVEEFDCLTMIVEDYDPITGAITPPIYDWEIKTNVV